MLDTCVKPLHPTSEVHGTLECEDGLGGGETGAEVLDGGSGEGAAGAVGEDQGWFADG
jgi:hypothetical protein